MDQLAKHFKKNVKKGFKKLFSASPDGREHSIASGLQGSTLAIGVVHSQPAFVPMNTLHSLPTTPLPRPERSDAAQPPAPVLSVPPRTEQRRATRDGWWGLKAFAKIVSGNGELLEPLKPAIEGILEVVETFELAAQNHEDYQTLRAELNTLFNDLVGWFGSSTPPTMTPSIINLAQGIERELENIRRKQCRSGVVNRIGPEMDADQILEHYRGVQRLLERLALNANISIWKIVSEQATETRLSKLPNSSAARYRSSKSGVLRDECIPNTRVQVLRELYEWARDNKSQKVYWLNGMAGTGKTTIAYSLCKKLEGTKVLAASFFCSRQLQECREVDRIVPTISYQLCRFSLPFQAAISQVLEIDPDVHNQPLLDQFRQLIFEPLVKVKDALPTSLVVVIDALDECDDNRRADILKCLLLYARDLPVKFFVASRPDARILGSMYHQKGDYIPVELRLHDLDRSIVEEDIRTYLRTKIASHVQLSAPQLEILVKRSGVLFIYAATVVRYIESNNFSRATKRIKEVLTSDSIGLVSDSDKGINALYSTILAAAFKDPDLNKSDRANVKQILNTVTCAQEPLSIEVMARLLGLDSETVHAALHPLLSILQISDTTQLITTLHESFPDYLLDKSRSGAFHCDAKEHNANLTRKCFDQINIPNPPFNICGLKSSYIIDKDVPDLPARVKKAVSNELEYACHYWGVHIMLAEDSQDLASMLLSFLSDRFLLWLEVMNLCGYISDGVKTLYRMQKWVVTAGRQDDNLRRLLRDGWIFATSFSSSPARLSTPHIYISALTFWPDHSLMKRYYKQDRSKLITSASTAMKLRSAIPLSVQDTQSGIESLSYSPDGAYVVSGSDDNTIQVWDAYTGQPVGQPMEGHTDTVTSVAYSPDSAYVVSGSDDDTIRIWDARTYQPVGEPMEGHTDSVFSVTYSPDGVYIVSGSGDYTIRVWDAQTRQPAGEPIEGHTDAVTSVGYSPDGTYIVSGSVDMTVRLWDARTYQPVGEPMEGHTDSVSSVTYSPDGAYIASGSLDNTILIWDACARQPVGQPMRGHTSAVNSVAYSPDGAHIVSGSDDYTMHIWDARSCQPVGQPVEGHNYRVTSIAYSPDGAYIASGSHDYTIRLWDAHTRQLVEQSIEGHTDIVLSVAYSPDGAYIASGSVDATICIWDAHTYQPVGELMEETEPVVSVAYSPDGAYIVSWSGDSIIRIWDAQTHQQVRQLMQRSISEVLSVSSESGGTKIRMNTQSASTLQTDEPSEGQGDSTTPVAYSPDGAYIVSRSDGATIRIWDAHTYQPVGEPMEGHTRHVMSVAYSPDGAYIVSGSDDETIRVWDTHTYQPVGQPMEGHIDSVSAVTYSPDGAYITSGSYDDTILIWDAQTRQPVGEPIEGHTDAVTSVGYSPDGTYIVSSSVDTTVRIWDVQTRQPVGQPLEGHTSPVMSVAYSPDGAYIISGSVDETIRVWDTQLVTPVTVVQKSHNDQSEMTHSLHAALGFNSIARRVLCGLGCQIDCPHVAWTLNDDGWIVYNNDKLIWVPPDLRVTLLSPQNTTVICRRGFLKLNLDRNKLGDRWCENFRPRKTVFD